MEEKVQLASKFFLNLLLNKYEGKQYDDMIIIDRRTYQEELDELESKFRLKLINDYDGNDINKIIIKWAQVGVNDDSEEVYDTFKKAFTDYCKSIKLKRVFIDKLFSDMWLNWSPKFITQSN